MKVIMLVLLLLYTCLSYTQSWIDTTYTIQTETDIVYGYATGFAGSEDTLMMDISYPEGDASPECGRPLMMIIHGGAWLDGDKNEGNVSRIRADFAKRGYVTASINYRLGLFHTSLQVNCNVPGWNCFNMTDSSEWYRANHRAIQDANGALRFLVNAAEAYQINPDNIFVVGESAGGFVAMGVGFIEDDTEVMTALIGQYPDALPPYAPFYEEQCIKEFELANSIAEMELSRPALGSYEGTLNLTSEQEYRIRGVGNIYGGAFNNIFQALQPNPPALYLYHQPCDLIVPFNEARVLAGYNNCLTGFPTFCQNIINRPQVYGSMGIKLLIDTLLQNNLPTSDYYFDNSGNNFNCLQQASTPALSCHAIDNYWIRTTNMATYFADFLGECILDNTSGLDKEDIYIQRIYPVPGGEKVYVDLNSYIKPISVDFYTPMGQTLNIPYTSKEKQLIFDIEMLPSGMYFFSVEIAAGRHLSATFIKN